LKLLVEIILLPFQLLQRLSQTKRMQL